PASRRRTPPSPGQPIAAPSRSARSRRSKSWPSRTAHAVISISTLPCCPLACARRMTRFLPRARPPTQSRTTCARRRPGTIPEQRQEPRHDRGSPTLHPVAASAALAHGSLHPGHAVYRRGHGVHGHAEISDARFNPQAAGHFYLAFAFFALILLHVAGALFHALVRRDGVFETMASAVTYGEVAPAKQGRHEV